MTTKLALALSWAAFVGVFVGYAIAQQVSPDAVQGCIVTAAAPTVTAGQRTVFTCNTAGQLRMSTTP